jgi:hypothetical protein
MSANLRNRKASSRVSERHSVNAERRSTRKESPKKNNSKEKVDNKRKSNQMQKKAPSPKKMPSPSKNTASRRSTRGKNEEIDEILKSPEPTKRRRFASEKMAEVVEIESEDIEEKTLATKKQDESPRDSMSSQESVDSDRPEHHHEQKDLPDKYQGAGFDISFYTKHMLLDMYPSKSHKIRPAMFSKKPLVQIQKLKKYDSSATLHMSKNKLSEKMGRRDILFYDLYKNSVPQELVMDLANKHLPYEEVLKCGEDNEDPIYGDIEVDNFEMLYNDSHLIDDKYGETISVKVKFNKQTGAVNREVTEDLDKVGSHLNSQKKSKSAKSERGDFDQDEEK